MGSRLIGFLAVTYLARTLGPENMGILAIGMAILTYASIISTLGLPALGVRYASEKKCPGNTLAGSSNASKSGFITRGELNFLFDANKLLVSRYQMMDWDGDGYVGGFNKSGYSDVTGDYNDDGQKEYDSRGYFDDPWYLAIFTSWLDDWYFGGDIDYSGDRIIGGYTWNSELDDNENGKPDEEELEPSETGIYGHECLNGKCVIEKGTGDNRSFKRELEDTVYNLGLEYWYTDNFALRTGYIYDFEGKIFNPTFGAGIRLLQYGFDFGYTAGEQGHPRANTMFFSLNIKI